jgi:hypothetical protein
MKLTRRTFLGAAAGAAAAAPLTTDSAEASETTHIETADDDGAGYAQPDHDGAEA